MKAAQLRPVDLLPDSDLLCFIVPGAFSAEACAALLTPERKAGMQPASTHYPTYYRNNERGIVDSETLARQLFAVVEQAVPATLPNALAEAAPWQLKGLNSRLRFCRYSAGQYFHRHLDGVYHASETVQSRLTFMVYLNDATEFGGGRTLFYRSKDDPEIWAEYWPSQGDLIVFDHRLWHEGEELSAGEKYVLRSDILYEAAFSPLPVGPPQPFEPAHLGYIWQVLPFGEWVLSAGRDTVINLWSSAGEYRQQLRGHQNSVLSLCQLNGDTLLSASRDTTIRVWQQQREGFSSVAVLQLHAATVLCLNRLSDTLFVSGAADKLIKISTVAGTVLHTLSGHTDWVWQVVPLAADLLLSTSEDGSLRLWNWRTGDCQQIIAEAIAPIHALLVDFDRCQVVSGNYAGEIQTWQFSADFRTWKLLNTLPAHRGIVRKLTQLPGGRLASGGEDNKVKIWNLLTGQQEAEIAHDDFVQATAWLPGRQELLSASYDGKLKVWELPGVQEDINPALF